MDQLPRLGKRELICLLSFTCNYVVFVWKGFLFLWVLGMGYVILLWHSLSLPYNYTEYILDSFCKRSCLDTNLQRGLHCWTYSFSPPQRCKLYFFNKPLELLYTNKTGGSPGSSIYVRHCTGSKWNVFFSFDITFQYIRSPINLYNSSTPTRQEAYWAVLYISSLHRQYK